MVPISCPSQIHGKLSLSLPFLFLSFIILRILLEYYYSFVLSGLDSGQTCVISSLKRMGGLWTCPQKREKERERARRVASLTKFRMSLSETLTSLSLSLFLSLSLSPSLSLSLSCSKLSLEFRMRITGNVSQATQAVQSMTIFNIIATFGLSFSLFGKQGKNPFMAMI